MKTRVGGKEKKMKKLKNEKSSLRRGNTSWIEKITNGNGRRLTIERTTYFVEIQDKISIRNELEKYTILEPKLLSSFHKSVYCLVFLHGLYHLHRQHIFCYLSYLIAGEILAQKWA